jgi:predicted PurR-regulated permease PerM
MDLGYNISKVLLLLIAADLFIIVVAGMQAATAIINPLLLAVFFATLCSPLLYGLRRLGLPNGVAVALIMLGLLVLALLLMVFVGRSVNALARELPLCLERLAALVNKASLWLSQMGVDISNSPLTDYLTPGKVMSVASYGLSLFRGLFTNIFLILLTVLFILLEASSFPRKIQEASADPARDLEQLKAMTENINRYMGLKALFSLATGMALWILLAFIGVDFAGTWGLLAFFLNFIPSIGSIIAAIPAILWALIQLGLPSALLTLLAYLAVNVTIGNFLEPKFMGRKLGLSPLVVFLSLIFWGWVLGPVGMVLSVPLTMIAKIALASSEDTRWIAVMLE